MADAPERVTPPRRRGASAGTIPLAPVLAHLRSTPSRTWSIVVTIFGDAVMPRGGSLWLGSLLDIFAGLETEAGAVRQSLSRLVADDWLERSRAGRHSFYALTATGRGQFARAAPKIYGARTEPWDGRFRIVLGDDGPDRDAVRAALRDAGFGTLAPDVWLSPATWMVPDAASGLPRLESRADLDTSCLLALRAWDLSATAAGYHRFSEVFAPVRAWIAAGGRAVGRDALIARTLLVHEYRRVVLRDPLLPAGLLPGNWPGRAARLLAADIYTAVLPASEAWLDAHGKAEAGPLPPPSEPLHLRFGHHGDSRDF